MKYRCHTKDEVWVGEGQFRECLHTFFFFMEQVKELKDRLGLSMEGKWLTEDLDTLPRLRGRPFEVCCSDVLWHFRSFSLVVCVQLEREIFIRPGCRLWLAGSHLLLDVTDADLH